MKIPSFENEIVVTRAKADQNPRYLKIETASIRAAQRAKKDRGEFCGDRIYALISRDNDFEAPAEFSMSVSNCFDIDQVAEYIQRPFE